MWQNHCIYCHTRLPDTPTGESGRQYCDNSYCYVADNKFAPTPYSLGYRDEDGKWILMRHIRRASKRARLRRRN